MNTATPAEAPPDTADSGTGQLVTLVVPAVAAMARVARLTASSVASLGDMTVDDIDDIKIAVSELMTLFIQHDDPSEITLRFDAGELAFSIDATMAVSGADLEGPEALLARAVLDAVCDVYELDSLDGRIAARVVKKRSDQSTSSRG